MSKKQSYVVDQLNRYMGRELTDCYAKPSSAKQYAWDTIKREMHVIGGWGLTVLSYNVYTFTCAYYAVDDAGNTFVVHHTPSKKEWILM